MPLWVWAQATLDARVAEIRELRVYVPEKALTQLREIEVEARAAPLASRVEFLAELSLANLGVGERQGALAIADELIALGKANHDDAVLAKAYLTKSSALSRLADYKGAHALVFDAEKLADKAANQRLRIQASIAAGRALEDQGNFPAALAKQQLAVQLANQYNEPHLRAGALNNLANLYDTMKEYDKGFEAMEESFAIATKLQSPGRMASAKLTESALAIDANQPQRSRQALLTALTLSRQIGAHSVTATTLVNLSDSYLKAGDFVQTVQFANEAIEAARDIKDLGTEATARVNIGQAYLGMSRIAEGKASFEAGMTYYEKTGAKPDLQSVLMEYGNALERAGDFAGAVAAYHRERRISDELFEKQKQKEVLELQEKYETDKKQRAIELLSRENRITMTELDNRRLQQRVWWLLSVVVVLAAILVGVLYRKVRQANTQLQVKNLELKQQSSRDPLTMLYNRRHFQDFMRTHQQMEARGSGPPGEDVVGALFLLDVDHFKHINDTYGHAAGDAVLTDLAASLREILRDTDMIVRWGGEEFLAFLPALPRSRIDDIARRLLSGIAERVIPYQFHRLSVNVSIGFAPFPLTPPEHPLTWEHTVNMVDMALYLAKTHGRNRAIGIRRFLKFDPASITLIEHDLEASSQAGLVEIATVLAS